MRDGKKRLDVFIGTPVEEPEDPLAEGPQFGEILYCVAFRREKDPLPEVWERIEASPADKPIYLYGKRTRGRFRETWWDGPDCQFDAIGVWHVKARRYVYYGTAESWYAGHVAKGILQKVVETSLKAGSKAISP